MRFLALFALLLTGCSTIISDIEAVSPVSGDPDIAAIGQNTNSDNSRRLNLCQWIDFLYARPARLDPCGSGRQLPAKGPAVALSSDDWRKEETAIGDLCIKGSCTYEQKQAVAKYLAFHTKVMEINERAMKTHGLTEDQYGKEIDFRVEAFKPAQIPLDRAPD